MAMGTCWKPFGPQRAQQRYAESAMERLTALESALMTSRHALSELEGEFVSQRKRRKRTALHTQAPKPAVNEAPAEIASVADAEAEAQSRRALEAVERTMLPNPLAKVRVSPRYGKVSSRLMCMHRSKQLNRKIIPHESTAGKYLQSENKREMQNLPAAFQEPVALSSRRILVWDRQTDKPLMHKTESGRRLRVALKLSGPAEAIDVFIRWCERGEAHIANLDFGEPALPFPVFIPSSGRANEAHLNWSAPHCFGPVTTAGGEGLAPVVLVVVEPCDFEAYRKAWPQSMILTLPEDGLGIAFSRWTVQRLCEGFREEVTRDQSGTLRGLRFCWMCDDNITCFYRLDHLHKSLLHKGRRLLATPKGRKRVRNTNGAMFAEAFCAVQQKARASDFAISGFLRDDGTASTKRWDWQLNNQSVYKVLLLNVRQLTNLGVEYLPQLKMFEDVCINTMARNAGGRVLKAMKYCYWADNKSIGGCSSQRSFLATLERPTEVNDIISASLFQQLPDESRKAVCQVAAWVRRDEIKSNQKAELEKMESNPKAELESMKLGQSAKGAKRPLSRFRVMLSKRLASQARVDDVAKQLERQCSEASMTSKASEAPPGPDGQGEPIVDLLSSAPIPDPLHVQKTASVQATAKPIESVGRLRRQLRMTGDANGEGEMRAWVLNAAGVKMAARARASHKRALARRALAKRALAEQSATPTNVNSLASETQSTVTTGVQSPLKRASALKRKQSWPSVLRAMAATKYPSEATSENKLSDEFPPTPREESVVVDQSLSHETVDPLIVPVQPARPLVPLTTAAVPRKSAMRRRPEQPSPVQKQADTRSPLSAMMPEAGKESGQSAPTSPPMCEEAAATKAPPEPILQSLQDVQVNQGPLRWSRSLPAAKVARKAPLSLELD